MNGISSSSLSMAFCLFLPNELEQTNPPLICFLLCLSLCKSALFSNSTWPLAVIFPYCCCCWSPSIWLLLCVLLRQFKYPATKHSSMKDEKSGNKTKNTCIYFVFLGVYWTLYWQSFSRVWKVGVRTFHKVHKGRSKRIKVFIWMDFARQAEQKNIHKKIRIHFQKLFALQKHISFRLFTFHLQKSTEKENNNKWGSLFYI